jgi:hypothetical protein
MLWLQLLLFKKRCAKDIPSHVYNAWKHTTWAKQAICMFQKLTGLNHPVLLHILHITCFLTMCMCECLCARESGKVLFWWLILKMISKVWAKNNKKMACMYIYIKAPAYVLQEPISGSSAIHSGTCKIKINVW